jgi:site-specific DNA-methyltransferase (adenine-specific)
MDLWEFLLKRVSLEGETVFDPFMGSGTTAVLCEQFGRKWIGVELSEKYCETAAKRITLEGINNLNKITEPVKT